MERFYYNLEKYKPYEIEASRRIKNKYNIDIKSFCDNNKYDFITTDDIKYEVKTDEASKKTNNFFIEFSGYKKPSGIATTESNYYILSNTVDYYLIETGKLKELIKNNTFKIVKVKTNDTYGYLINKNIIILNSIII